MQSIEKSGLIWITGFSSSGKTTISRKVEFILRKKNYRTIFLDGEDLRLILGDGWGYERDKRMELAHIYFRMCSHLSSQGYIVIISAVAMFEEVSLWVRENIKNSMQVYLDVPSEIRLQRDARTKKLFLQKKLSDSDYEIPNAPDLIIRNYGDMSTDEVARIIVNEFVNSERVTLDYNRKTYWNAHYKKQAVSTEPSSFSTYVESKIRNNQKILEIGSGTGRDAVFFSEKGHSITAIDRSEEAIEFCLRSYSERGIRFLLGSFLDIDFEENSTYNIIYSRFVFNDLTLEEELKTIQKSFDILNIGGEMYIECRTVSDSLFRKGRILSKTERVYGHYRRFIVLDELLERLESQGFKVLPALENYHMVVNGNDNSAIIRICVKKG